MPDLEALIGFVLTMTAATAIEYVAPIERYSLRSRKFGFALSLIYALGGAFLVFGLQGIWSQLGLEALIALPIRGLFGDIAALAIAIIVADFLAYWHHRMLHRFFWPVHAVHHSQTDLNAANSYGHLIEKVTQFFAIATPLSLVQFDSRATPVVAVFALQLLEFYIHAPTRAHLGKGRLILVDNRFHRIHHSTEKRHFDRNFGILFSVWDRLFGTVCDPQSGEWPTTGISGHPPPRSVFDYLLYPIRYNRSGS